MSAVSSSTILSPQYRVRWFRSTRLAKVEEYKYGKYIAVNLLSRERHPNMDEKTWRALVNAQLCPEHFPDCMIFKGKKLRTRKGGVRPIALCTCGYDSLYQHINSILADHCEKHNLYVEVEE